ncbi:MAG: hypothetical protein AAB414_03275 [Patescibacteria group bacterium]
MNTPDRADIRPDVKPAQATRSGILQLLPHEVRVSTLSSRLLLATLVGSAGVPSIMEVFQALSGNTPTAEAADPNCQVGARIESYTFFDMAQVVPEWGRRHILDMGIDPRAGAVAGFTVDAVPITYKKGDRSKPDYRPLASANIVRDGNVGRGQLQFSTPCNTEAVTSEGKKAPALRFKVVSSLDPDNDQFEVVTPDGRRSVVAFGSEIKKPEDFLKIVDSGTSVQDLDEKKKELIAQAQKQTVQPTATSLTVAATPTSVPAPVPDRPRIPGLLDGVGDFLGERASNIGSVANATRQGMTENAGFILPLAAGAAGLLAYRRFVPAGTYAIRGRNIPRHVTVRGRRII